MENLDELFNVFEIKSIQKPSSSCCLLKENIDINEEYYEVCCKCGKIGRFAGYQNDFIQQRSTDFVKPIQRYQIHKKKFYECFTNLRDHFYLLLGNLSGNSPCRDWNLKKCYKSVKQCRFIHRCLNCMGKHNVKNCKIDRNWFNDLCNEIDFYDKWAFYKIFQYLKSRGINGQYKNIFNFLYQKGLKYPQYTSNQIQTILQELRNIHHFFNDFKQIKKSMPSSYMILDYVFQIHNIPFPYEIPVLKSDEARERVFNFLKTYHENHFPDRYLEIEIKNLT